MVCAENANEKPRADAVISTFSARKILSLRHSLSLSYFELVLIQRMAFSQSNALLSALHVTLSPLYLRERAQTRRHINDTRTRTQHIRRRGPTDSDGTQRCVALE